MRVVLTNHFYSKKLRVDNKQKNTNKPVTTKPIYSASGTTFKGYYGDIQPVKKLFYIVSGKNAVYEDAWTNSHLYQVGSKKWVNAHPIELMKRTAEQALQSICTLIKPNNQYPGFHHIFHLLATEISGVEELII